eukprot:TRINITY_DN1622_c0_g1_i1.p1 TRINITY_DN1622_c0_g1~~TRINITY_DN1622_c0_g1_i1.p1  ORF type:complete len:783 (+),score=183.69 TRINITY_DN1622_c0_g1_i1:112-2349(+)
MAVPHIALIGAGYWGKNYIRIMSQLESKGVIKFAGVYEAHSPTREGLRFNYPGVRFVENVDLFLKDSSLVAVVVVTPAGTHAKVLEQCINAGKHILVEKPLTLDTATSKKCIELAKAKGVTLMVGHTFLFNSSVRELKQRVENPDFGKMHYIHCKRTNLGPIRQDTSALWDLAPHDVSIVLYLMQSLNKKLIKVSATGSKTLKGKHHDTVWAHMMFEDDIVAQVHVSWLDPHKVRDVVIVSDRHRLAFDDMDARMPVKIFQKGVELNAEIIKPGEEANQARGFTFRDGEITVPVIAPTEPLSDQFNHFLECIQKGQTCRSPGEFGLEVVAVMEAAELSMEKDGQAIFMSQLNGQAPPSSALSAWPAMAPKPRCERTGDIPLVDIQAGYMSVKEEVDKDVCEIFAQGCFIEGPKVKEFETEFAKFLGAKHAIGVNSGTDALYLAYRYLGLEPGDEIITQANTFIATCLGASTLGANIKLVDVEPGTGQIDVTKIEAAITPKTKIIVPVHLYGHAANMEAIMAIAKKHDLKVVEDASQAHGARFKDQRVGGFGDAACFSFYPGKNLGAFGDGGALVTNDDALAARIRAWRAWGAAKKYHHTEKGGNSRLDTVQAAVLLRKLHKLDAGNEKRRRLAATYSAALKGVGDLTLPSSPPNTESVWHLYVICTEHRDALLKHLNDNKIGAGIHYPLPIHKQECYSKELSSLVGTLPQSEKEAPRMLSLPVFPEMTDVQQQRVIDCVKAFFKK